MEDLTTTVELRRDQIFGLYALVEPTLADALEDYFDECHEAFVRDFPGASRLAQDGRVTVLFPGARSDVMRSLGDYGVIVTAPAADAEPENRRYPVSIEVLLQLGQFDGSDDADETKVFPQFAPSDIPDLMRMVADDELHRAPQVSAAIWAPLHAMRALGELRAEAATETLLAQLRRIDEDEDDFVGSDVERTLAGIGPATMESTARYLANTAHGQRARIAAAQALRSIGQSHPDARADCVAHLTRQLALGTEHDRELNGFLIASLLDLKATESLAEIERAFAADHVDETIAGDWEETQIEFGLKQRRDRPRRPNELTEMSRKFRAALGLPPIDELAGSRESLRADERLIRQDSDAVPPAGFVKPVPLRAVAKPGRNDPCSCGSGKKFKKCCGA